MKYLLLFPILFLIGCSNHTIDIGKYRPIPLKKSPYTPTAKELNKKSMRVVVLNIDHQVNSFAKRANIGYIIASELSTKLVETKQIRVIQRLEQPTFLNEQKIFELVKKHNIKKENADYLLTGRITQARHNYIYHKGREMRGGGGIDSSISYSACLSGTINLFKLPSMQIQEVFPFEECAYDGESISRPDKNRDYTQLLAQTSSDIIDSIMPKLTKRLKPRGYIYAMRINGDKKIIKTTLNRTLGAIEGRKVEILKIEKEKNLRGEEDTIEIPIGRGTISNIITDSYSFITVDELRDEVHSGDMVRVID